MLISVLKYRALLEELGKWGYRLDRPISLNILIEQLTSKLTNTSMWRKTCL